MLPCASGGARSESARRGCTARAPPRLGGCALLSSRVLPSGDQGVVQAGGAHRVPPFFVCVTLELCGKPFALFQLFAQVTSVRDGCSFYPDHGRLDGSVPFLPCCLRSWAARVGGASSRLAPLCGTRLSSFECVPSWCSRVCGLHLSRCGGSCARAGAAVGFRFGCVQAARLLSAPRAAGWAMRSLSVPHASGSVPRLLSAPQAGRHGFTSRWPKPWCVGSGRLPFR